MKENIETDHSSIYLTTDESIIFDGESVIGKNVLMKSDSVRISGKERIIINSPNLSVKDDEIKLGNGANQSVVKGDELKKVLLDLISALEKATYIGVAPGSPTTPAVNVLEFTSLRVKLETILSNKVKTS